MPARGPVTLRVLPRRGGEHDGSPLRRSVYILRRSKRLLRPCVRATTRLRSLVRASPLQRWRTRQPVPAGEFATTRSRIREISVIYIIRGSIPSAGSARARLRHTAGAATQRWRTRQPVPAGEFATTRSRIREIGVIYIIRGSIPSAGSARAKLRHTVGAATTQIGLHSA